MKVLYFIAVPVPSPISEEIIKLKNDLKDRYHSGHSLKTIPHITLQMPVRLEEEFESEFISSLKVISNKIESGKITIDSVDGFPPRTIFLDVKKEGTVVQLSNAVKKILYKLKFFPHQYVAKQFHPHVTLMTRDLNQSHYSQAIQELKKLQFERVFTADKFCLFKHNGKNWEILFEYNLKR